MEKLRKRSKSRKRPDPPSSPTRTSKVSRMTEDSVPGAQDSEFKDKNQNSLPEGDAGPNRCNGL